MKTAQDISPTAVVCLGVGLLVANMLMPENQKFEFGGSWQPTQNVTPVDLREGLSLERLPPGEIAYTYSKSPIRNEAHQRNATAVEELFDLLQRTRAEKSALMSDAAVLLSMVFFVFFGMATAFIDRRQLAEDENTSEVVATPSKKEVTQTIASSALQIRRLKYTTFCICSVAVTALMLLFCSARFKGLAGSTWSPEEDTITQDLRKLLNITSEMQRPPLASDSCVLLILAAFLVIAVFVMKADIHEMAEELRRKPNRKMADMPKVQEKKSPKNSHQIQRVFGSLATVGILAVLHLAAWQCLRFIATAALSTGDEPTRFAEQASMTELKALVHSSINMLPDFILEFVLGACTVLGLAVMRVDICDMVKELKEQPGSKMTLASSSRTEEKVKAS